MPGLSDSIMGEREIVKISQIKRLHTVLQLVRYPAIPVHYI